MERFHIAIPDAVFADLHRRLDATRWPDEVAGAGWDYGVPADWLKGLARHWRHHFDWRAHERRLNALPQWRARVGEHDIHFVHARGVGPKPLPLIITHGWPSTFAEMEKIIGPLTDPAAHGGDELDAFDVVVPSMPGFGFSSRPARRGPPRVHRLWAELMTRVLGYPRFLAHGTDVGARVTSALGRYHGDVVQGIHIASVDLDWPDPLPDDLSASERDYVARCDRWTRELGAYGELQATTPQTAAYGLNDSPVALAAWIAEKFRAWSDCGGDIDARFTLDELLANITIYWATETINSSMRRYYEVRHDPAPEPLRPGERINTPAGIAMFPGEALLSVPREFAERCYNVVQWTDPPSGGHFPAMEEPALLVQDLRAFGRLFR